MSAAAFQWSPKPPVVPESHPTQRYFCPPGREVGFKGITGSGSGVPEAEVNFLRFASDNYVRLSVSVQGGAAYAGSHLTADELRAVARLCLDCAHDLDTFTAEVLTARRES